MTKTTVFRAEGECPHGCRRPDDCIDCIDAEAKGLREIICGLLGSRGTTEHPMWEAKAREAISYVNPRTAMQCHSNCMLMMRRTMKGIAQVMRVERWQRWKDSAPPAGEIEPELRNEDLDAYLKAAGHTEESMVAHLAKIQAIVQEAIDRDEEDG